jgi:branched-chain amino acid transport system permease protein
MSYYLDVLIGGMANGCLYAVATVGLTLVYGVLRILHIAHAAVFALGALSGVAVANASGSAWAGLAAAVIFAVAAGCAIYRIVYAPLLHHPAYVPLIASIGVLITMTDGFRILFGEGGTAVIDNPFATKGYDFGDVHVGLLQIIIAGAAVVTFSGLALFMRLTRSGVVWRATVSKPAIARAFGVDIRAVHYLVFAIGSALAGVAGLLTGYLDNLVEPNIGEMVGYKALAIIVLGGLGSIQGALVASLTLGVGEAFGSAFLGDYLDRDAIAALVLIGVLLVRPTGLARKVAAA